MSPLTNHSEAGVTLPFAGFSGPFEPFDESTLNELVLEVTQVLFSQLFQVLRQPAPGPPITALIQKRIESLTSPTLITPSLSLLFSALQAGTTSAILQASACFLLETGTINDCDRVGAFLPRSNAYLLGTGDIYLFDPLSSHNATPEMSNGFRLHKLPNVSSTIGTNLYLVSAVSGCAPLSYTLPFALVNEIPNMLVASFETACSILCSLSLEYGLWIGRVLRYVAVTDSPSGRLISGSAKWLWGLIVISNSTDPVDICEMLVHECSHLYFNLALHVFNACDPTLTSFSPFKQAIRPLEKVMLAYHAFGNVAQMYERLIGIPAFSARASQRRTRVVAELSGIHSAISPHLHDSELAFSLLNRSRSTWRRSNETNTIHNQGCGTV